MILTLEQLDVIAGTVNRANGNSLVLAVTTHPAGLDRPHRLAQFLAQVLHESGGLRHVREIWGPTVAQKRYEGRLDLGNTQPGDGKRFMGRGLIQCTGRANYRSFSQWCWATGHVTAPDFEQFPADMEQAPWSALVAIWFWDERRLNFPADKGDIRAITQTVNGGFNGLSSRMKWYASAGLMLLGKPVDVAAFQREVGLTADGIAGPLTCAALHLLLVQATEPEPTLSERLAALEARVAALEGRA